MTSEADWKRWSFKWGALPELLSVIPPGAPIAPSSEVTAGGKTPGHKGSDGWYGLGGKWPDEFRMDLKKAKRAALTGATIGIQGRIFMAGDIDIEDTQVALDIQQIAFEHLGATCIRTRDSSERRLLMYRLAEGLPPMRKKRVEIETSDGKSLGAVEWLAKGQYYNVEGPHPSGGFYKWDRDPCDIGADNITRVTSEQVANFFAAIEDYCDTFGLVIKTKGSLNPGTPRKSLDDPSLHAPGGPAQVLELLKTWRPDDMGHDEYVQTVAAIKASFGPRREEFKGKVLAWSPGIRSTEDEAFEKRWDSIKDSSLGWNWLTAKAGFFEYEEVKPGDNPDGEGNPVEQMLERYVWCEGLERYDDIQSNTTISAKSFNARNVGVAEFGRTGVRSAEAEFQNNPNARKVAIATYRPGKGIFIEDTNAGGAVVTAVNRWRPSSLVPDRHARDEDVGPWLDHVELIFGDLSGPAARHFLNYVAFLLQRPGEKINHAMVLFGEEQGTGKDTVLYPVFQAIGDQNVKIATPEKLASQWTEYLLAQVVYVPEIMNFSRREMATKLKDFITTPPYYVSVNTKNVKQYDIPKIQNWIMSTNNEDALSIEGTDRRYWVHQCCLEVPREPEYYANLHDWFHDGGTEKVAGWLLKRDLSAFNPLAPPPNTDAKRKMLKHSQPLPVRRLLEDFAEGGAFANRTVMIVQELLDKAERDFYSPNHKNAVAALQVEGFEKGPRPKIDGDARRLWVRDPEGMLSKLSDDQIRDKYFLEAARGRVVRDATIRELSVREEPSRKKA